jgi:hypothetical protein
MTYMAALFAYSTLYQLMYMSPFALVLYILPAKYQTALEAPILVCCLGGLVLGGMRATLAARRYGSRDMGFWEAHRSSGEEIRWYLGLLPLIGGLFKRRGK